MGYCIGWDIGGANIKASLISLKEPEQVVIQVNDYFEMWQDFQALASTLTDIVEQMIPITEVDSMAVTITAELADAFRTKEEGVRFVVHSLEKAFPSTSVHILTTDATFVSLQQAVAMTLKVSAANWIATASMVAKQASNAMFMDMGSTTTDIIPICDGGIVVNGKTDPGRLTYGELVYTGMLRNNVCSLVDRVPVDGKWLTVSSEYFVTTGDIHLLLQHISPEQFTAATADGRPAIYQYSLERLARLVCADINMMSEESLLALARFVSEKQMQRITDNLLHVASRFPQSQDWPVVVTGLGEELCAQCGERAGMKVLRWHHLFPNSPGLAAPSHAVAYLLIKEMMST